MTPPSRHRRAVKASAGIRARNAKNAALLKYIDFDLAKLFEIADRRGYTIALERDETGGLSLHMFTRRVRSRSKDPKAWMLTPAGVQLASADVIDHDYDAAARDLWVAVAQGSVGDAES